MTLEGVYDGIARVWAMALGRMAKVLGGVDNPETLAVGAYRHTIEIDPAMHSHAWQLDSGVRLDDAVLLEQQLARRATLVVQHGAVSTWEFKSAMLNGLTLTSTTRRTRIALSWLAHSLDRASVINPNLDAAIEPLWQPLGFDEMEFRIAPFSDSTALDSGDSITVGSMRLTIANRLVSRQTEGSGYFIGEPKRNALPTITGAFVLPRYEADTLLDWARDKAELMLSAVYTGPEIAATGVAYELGLYVPSLTLSEVSMPTTGPRQTRQAFTFEATVPTLPAAGMPTTQDAATPFIVQVVDDESGNALYAP